MDILAAIFAAVADGVQVLSLSIGGPAADYAADLMSLGTLYAVNNGVTVVCSAGNSGPQPGSVSNLAPWMLTVAASTMDRDFPGHVTLGNSTIKPDITAPGVDVIAAYSEEVPATDLSFEVPYNMISGTSMSCPHVAGVAGLIKAKYPGWSPAMTIMTTASTVANDYSQIRDETGGAATPFSYGSGHLNPVPALDPGLVYDTAPFDYANFLCSLKPTQTQSLNLLPVSLPQIIHFNSNPFKCSLGAPFRPENLNYPSISATCISGSTTVRRRVTNVGAESSTSTVSVVQPAAGVTITVQPSTLSFGRVYEERSFTVKLEVYDPAAAADYVFGSIAWSDGDGNHRVRSPVIATTKCT